MVSPFFGSFARNLINKLSTGGSNLNFRIESVNDVEFFFLKGALTQNFNIVDLVSFFGKSSITSHSDRSSHIEDEIMQIHGKKKSEKSEKSNKKILSTLPFNPWAVLATWLHVGAPQKIQEK
jgi:hypothetical protein